MLAPNAGVEAGAEDAGVPKAVPKLNPPEAAEDAPKAGVLLAPKAGVLLAPKAGVLLAPKAGVLLAPKPPPPDQKELDKCTTDRAVELCCAGQTHYLAPHNIMKKACNAP